MNDFPRCPKCGAWLESDDSYDLDMCGEFIRVCVVGHCADCNSSFQWIETYDFSSYGDLEELKED